MKTFLMKAKLPLILLSILVLSFLFGQYIPSMIKSILFAISLSIKEVLLTVIPFVVFSFIFSSLISLRTGALSFIILLIIFVFCSNFIAIVAAYEVGTFFLNFLNIAQTSDGGGTVLQAAWELHTPRIIPNETALLAGFIVGIFFALVKSQTAEKVAATLNKAATFFLKKMFLPLLPLFILGFVLKLEEEHLLQKLFTIYAPVFLVVVGLQVTYMVLFYFIASKFSLKRALTSLKNVSPATLTGFSTMSSLATMPVLIMSTERNIPDQNFVKTIIPATVNIHTLGSAIALTILALTTLHISGASIPTFSVFLVFAVYWAIAKFAVAAVPGGAIIVAAPLLEKYLGLNGEMIGLLTAIYMIFDPFGTATNVTGNGGFALLFLRIYRFFTERLNKMVSLCSRKPSS